MIKIYLIPRVSTDDQKSALPAQTLRLKSYATKLRCKKTVLREIQESAFKGDRQDFRRVVDEIEAAAETGKEKIIVAFDKIDRLTRDPASPEYIRLSRMCAAGKIELHFPADNIIITADSPAADKLRLGMGISVAQYYSDAISDNVKRRQAQMLHDGIWTGAAPFGYQYTTKNGQKWLEPHPVNAEIVRYTFESYATGTSSLITLRKEWRTRFNNPTTQTRVHNILRNPFYHGVMRVKDRLYPHNYTPLVSKEVFDKVQKVREGYAVKPHQWAGLPFSYRSLMHCAECGCRITFEIKKKKYIYGHCTQKKYKHGAKYINEDKLTLQLTQTFKDIHIPDEVLYQLQEYIRSLKSDAEKRLEQKRSTLMAGARRYSTMLDKLYDDRLEGLITDDKYRQKHEEFSQAQQKHEESLQRLELLDSKQLDNYSHLLELANKAPELFKKSDFEEKRKLIKKVCSNLLLDVDLLRWKYKKPFDLMAFCSKNAIWQDLQDLFRNRTLPVLDLNLPLVEDILERHALTYDLDGLSN